MVVGYLILYEFRVLDLAMKAEDICKFVVQVTASLEKISKGWRVVILDGQGCKGVFGIVIE